MRDALSRGELTSCHSGELELKQSEFSPVHSKRSLSADTVKKLLSVVLENGVSGGGGGALRVVSAGDVKSRTRPHDGRGGTKGRGKGGSADSTDGSPRQSRKSSADPPFWKAEVVPLLRELESTSYRDVQHLCDCCSSLWACLERRGLLGRTGGEAGTKKRGIVLRTVFKMLDHKEPKLLLKVARIIIAVSYINSVIYVLTRQLTPYQVIVSKCVPFVYLYVV